MRPTYNCNHELFRVRTSHISSQATVDTLLVNVCHYHSNFVS